MDWPQPARPYFMIAFDTSLSMNTSDVGSANSCGYANTRNGHARCALRNMINAFAGEVNFGLAAFPGAVLDTAGSQPSACPTGVGTTLPTPGCSIQPLHTGDTTQFLCGTSMSSPAQEGANAKGGNILVELPTDEHWNPGFYTSNLNQLLPWVDNVCGDCRELWTAGGTPLNGLLRDVERYLKIGWSSPLGGIGYVTPLETGEFERYGENGFDACRSVNVILLTDGEESCDSANPPGENDATAAQAQLAAQSMLAGWTLGENPYTIQWKAYTHVIAFGQAVAGANLIAAAGGTNVAKTATDEAQLSAALAAIIQGSIDAEVCDNQDNNCNGCTDEGFRIWCNRDKTELELGALPVAPGSEYCCAGPTRQDCLDAYADSIDPDTNPKGDPGYLPCWDPSSSASEPEHAWLCTDPGESCDEEDNNCELTVETLSSNVEDEGFQKCPACPSSESCDGVDNDCDGHVDNQVPGQAAPKLVGCGQCVKKTEICNGCDDDCDGQIDEDVPPVPCGRTSPAHCKGVQTCVPSSGAIGACNGSPPVVSFTECTNDVQTEACNNQDDDCDGVVDNDVPGLPAACSPNGQPLEEGECVAGTLLCQAGQQKCLNYKGPAPEICDGKDNDCDGSTDEPNDMTGVGLPCGTEVGNCEKGVTVCSGGVIVCNQPLGPLPEECDGEDNNCNGLIDEAPLDDQPGETGCWDLAPNDELCAQSCNFLPYGIWCAPPGANCQDIGSLGNTPCSLGTLTCQGGAWQCVGGVPPVTEQCDGVDNDCDSDVDAEDTDILPAPIGEPCGQDGPLPCEEGTIICEDGAPKCDGGKGPTPEVCDAVDNDCNGVVNNGIPLGDSCTVQYDALSYPGDRTQGVCRPGQLECTETGALECVGGVGPSPEICDGLDNDCDGVTDEPGAAPDGVTGTVDPDEADRVLGEACGGDGVGTCKAGKWGCEKGAVACVGGIQAQPEICDCVDNDCDGRIDEDAEPGEAALCSSGKTCVEVSADLCQCAAECGSGEFPCPGGFTCRTDLDISGTDEEAPDVCVISDPCGVEGCSGKSVTGSSGQVECAPLGSQPGSSRPIPECTCAGLSGCQSPCAGAECPDGQRCVSIDPFVGECRSEELCMLFGCPGGQFCTMDGCRGNPCAESECESDEVCKPSPDYSIAECVPSCAGVSCDEGELCEDGECKATGCGKDCPRGQFCLGEVDDRECRKSSCPYVTSTGAFCDDGSYCDVATGTCGVDDPCGGVVCPAGQICAFGQCGDPRTSDPPDTGEGGEAGEGPVASAGTTGTPKSSRAVYGLATGGGGCGCRTVGHEPRAFGAFMALSLAGAAFERRRRRRQTRGFAVEGGVS